MIDKERVAIISGKDLHKAHSVLAILNKNALFGEMALIYNEVRSATAFALEDCQFSVISRKTLNYLIKNDPITISPLLEVLSQRLRQTTKLLKDKVGVQHEKTKHHVGWANHNNESIVFYKGDIIFFEGQYSNCVYIIESGRVSVYQKGYRGKRSLVSILEEKKVFGEMGLIDKYPRSATTIALQDTRCIVIERSRFNYLKNFSPYFVASLIKSLTKKLRGTIAKLNKISPTNKVTLIGTTTLSKFSKKWELAK
jgi:CRP/FNR family transcriptional regulator, cyclic AMP receptor protein